ncbi:MAG: Y-family DNA polymerase [Inquilinaceae bacterium]
MGSSGGPVGRSTGFASAPDDIQAPFCLTEDTGHGLAVAAANRPAGRLGIGVGMRLTDARALYPALGVEPIDRAADRRCLTALARWAVRYTPAVLCDGRDGLLLDMTGAAHLVGGEEALCRDVARRLRAVGLTVRVGIADTAGAAWAVTRYGKGGVVPVDRTARVLAPLPVAALRLSADAVDLLQRLGLTTVGALYDIPRAALQRRFSAPALGDAVVLRLDQVLGRAEEALTFLPPPRTWRATAHLFEPVTERAQIEAWLETLGHRLAGLLGVDGLGARRLRLTACRVDNRLYHVEAGLGAPSRSPVLFRRLLAEGLDRIDPGFGIDRLVLAADGVEPLAPAQTGLLDVPGEEDPQPLIDLLRVKLGGDAVWRLEKVASHMPERAQCRSYAPPVDPAGPGRKPAAPPATPGPLGPRPVLFLPRPEKVEVMAEVPEGPPRLFVWRRTTHRVSRAAGPERIEPEWWRRAGAVGRPRDYYYLEDTGGRRFWLFRHGLYDRGDLGVENPAPHRPPQWYVHGLFG